MKSQSYRKFVFTGLKIINKYEYPSIAINTFVALSLQWLHNPSCLTENALKVASKIIDLHRSKDHVNTKLNMPNLYANKIFKFLLPTDNVLSMTFRLLRTWERIRDNPEKLRRWFDNFETVNDYLKLQMVPFLLGIVMEENLEEFSMRALNIVLTLVSTNKDLAVSLLPILVYEVANEISPRIKLQCLKAVPDMAVSKVGFEKNVWCF